MTTNQLPWFAIRVKSRFEKVTSELLRAKGYEEFLPLYWSRRRWSDRIKLVELPLFAGYVFCRFAPHDRAAILATPGVFLIVGQQRTPIAIDSAQIENIRRAVNSGQPAQPWPRIEVGQKVQIEMGPLRGSEGTVLRWKGSSHLIVGIELLQRSVAVELDENWVISSKPVPIPMPVYSSGLKGTSADSARQDAAC